jgi:signal transduction histidine kinase/PAS domain-containing protein
VGNFAKDHLLPPEPGYNRFGDKRETTMAGIGKTWDPQRVLESTPAALLVLDPDFVIVEANEAYLAATMTDRDTILGRTFPEIFPDDPAEQNATGEANVRASLRRVLDHRVADVMAIQKYAIPRPDSDGGGFETRYWAAVNAPVFTSDGDLGWIVHKADDVTAYVRDRAGDPDQESLASRLRLQTAQMEAAVFARQQLLEQNESLQAVLDSLDTAVVGCDRDGRAILTNQSARDMFALPVHGEPVDGWTDRFEHLAISDAAGNPLESYDLPIAMLLRGQQVKDMLIVAKADREAPRTFRVNGRTVDDGGRLAAVVALHDITVQQRAERLKDCELQVADVLAKPEPADHLLHNTVELIGSMLGWALVEFWSVDQVGQVLRRSACWATDSDHMPDDLANLLYEGEGVPGQAWHTTEPIWATDLKSHSGADHQSADWRRLHSALAVPIPSGVVVLGVLTCYSDNHEIPDDMRTAVMTGIAAHLGKFLERRRADQANAELDHTRDEYIALVGHELRTPLTSVESYADMLLDEPDMPADDRREMLEVIRRRTGELHELVAKLLDVAGTRAGHIALQTRRIDLVAVARDAIGNAETVARPVTIALNAPTEAIIDGDPDRLRIVLDELLGNALTWAPDGSTIGLNIQSDSHTAVVAITNTGARISADEHQKIFDAFFRTDKTRHHGIPGFGLGLTLARAVVEQHGGSLTVSEPEEAITTFSITLPIHQAAPPHS